MVQAQPRNKIPRFHTSRAQIHESFILSPPSMMYKFCGECPYDQNTAPTLVEIQEYQIMKCEHNCFVLCVSQQDFYTTGINQINCFSIFAFSLVVQVGFPCLGKQDGVAAFEVNVIVMNSEGNTILQTPQNAIFFKTCQQGNQ